ncbi:MAG: hypothetical protein R6V38_05095 [Roseovarius gahaiensis]
MKTTVFTVLALAAFSGAAIASGLSDPVVAPEVIAADAVDTSDKIGGLVAFVTVLLIILGAAGV